MEHNSNLPVANGASKRGLNRREMVQRLFAGTGAAIALPGVAAAHPIHKHLADASVLEAADAQTAAQEWSPAFLDAHQNQTLVVLAERIVPGSTKAQVNRFIDLLLSVDTQDSQKKFLAALSAFEAEALNRHGHPYKDLTEEQQNQILTDALTAKPAEEHGFRIRRRSERAEPQPEPVTLRDHFENMKSWVSGAYYSSEVGMRELGWTGNYFYESYPGCQHPEEHH
jgi:Gluconate 2-dehydrogenase subunit 3